MRNRNILYIGNDLSAKTKYNSSMATLGNMLQSEGFNVKRASEIKNKFLRIIDMLWAVFINRNRIDYLLIDTFSTSNFLYAFATSQMARLFFIKYIPILRGGNLPYRLDTSRYFSKLLFRNSYKNITPSKYLQQAFIERGFETVCIPNSIPIKEYDFKERKKLIPKILWVRAFDKTYNPLLAIKVLNLLKIKFENIQLCMVGPDKDGSLNEVKLLVGKLNLTKNIIFTGVLPKEKWHQLSEDYDIFINTTDIDNMPVSILEAMALGLPIVSTNVGGIPYLITDNENGVLVPPKNEKAMADAIIKLINNPETSNRISCSVRLFAEKFDLEIIKEQWFNLLK
jgi:glycosyltransferase involved in cell wall biosynthesis